MAQRVGRVENSPIIENQFLEGDSRECLPRMTSPAARLIAFSNESETKFRCKRGAIAKTIHGQLDQFHSLRLGEISRLAESGREW
jgi:hypothetical protein